MRKPASSKAALAKGAAEIRKLTAKSLAAKKPAPDGALTVPPPFNESTEEIKTLLKKHVVIAEDYTYLRIKDDTEIGEFLPIYDFIREEAGKAKDKADKWQFIEGDCYNEGKRLFGKEFAVLMATNGRPVSTLKKFGSISANIDTALRNLHPKLDWSHVAEVAKVPNEADKRDILEAAAKKLEGGESVSVKDIRTEADKHKPRKPQGKKPAAVKYEMNVEEQSLITAFHFEIEPAVDYVSTEKKNLRALLPKLTGSDKKAIVDSLELLAELYALVK